MNKKLDESSRTEAREWWLAATAISVTLLLTSGIVILASSINPAQQDSTAVELRTAVEGLVGVVLLFDLYVLFQRLQIYRLRKARIADENLFQLISENAADMIAVVDAQGQRRYNSPSYERILGYTQDELRASAPLELVHPDDVPLVSNAMTSAQKGNGMTIEYRMRHKDGHWVQIESTANVTRDENGSVDRVIVINRDVGERKAQEERRTEVRKMEAVERLSSGIAHEFNNLLGVILAFTELLQVKLDVGDSRYRDVEQIRLAGLRAAKLTKQLLVFSQQQSVNRIPLELNCVVAGLAPTLSAILPPGVEVATSLQNDVNLIRADRFQVEQLVVNLAVNAGESMPSGGKLTISTRNAVPDDAERVQSLNRTEPSRFVCLEIKDTGVGVDAHTRARMFEPFFTTKSQKSGLGLAVVSGIVRDNDGLIEVDGATGFGTTFRIYFPSEAHPGGPVSPHAEAYPCSKLEHQDVQNRDFRM